MKIEDKYKGISYNPNGLSDSDMLEYYESCEEEYNLPETDGVLEMIEKNKQAQIEWEKQGEINFTTLLKKQKTTTNKYKIAKSSYLDDKNKTAKKQGMEISKLKNYPPFDFTPQTNFIGERIEYLMSKNNQEIAEISLNIGMSRSSLHRYIKGTHLPSEKALRKIIDGLYVSVSDFCYEPDDFEKWKSAFESSTEINDIFKFKEKILEQLRINNFTYKNNGLILRLPNRYYVLFRKLISDAVDVLDLLPHDKN